MNYTSVSLLFVISCSVYTAEGKVSLSLESARGKMRLKNFYHLHGHRLKVSPQATLEVEKDMKCTASCIRNKECFSMNVKKISSNLFFCELLNTSKYIELKNLTKDENFVHWYLQDPCTPSPCFEETRGACIVSSDETAVTCKCFETYEGKACEKQTYALLETLLSPFEVDFPHAGFNESQGMITGVSVPVHIYSLHFADPDRNYALNKPATQKTWSDRAGKAVDGNNNPAWRADSCTGTQSNNPDPQWWRVDFEEEVQVARVIITNRDDPCCGHRLGNFVIRVGNTLDNDGLTSPTCGGNNLSVGTGATKTFLCSPFLKGRYLVIQSYVNDVLTICEVEVYAYP